MQANKGADLDSVVALGGLVESPGSDAEEHVPKTLFDPKDDRMDETNFAKPSAASDNDSLAMPLLPTSLPPSKTCRLLQQALDKKQKKNRKRNKTPTPNSNPTKARRTPFSSSKKASNLCSDVERCGLKNQSDPQFGMQARGKGEETPS
jgi:hypothetical protein